MRRANQFERTDRDITNAVLEIMDHKPFEKITVQEILDEAMVNRTTFYQHFQDKYAVLEHLQEKYIGGMTQRVGEVISAGNYDMEKINAVLYEYMLKHRQKMRKLIIVRSENLDMEAKMREVFSGFLRQSGAPLSEVEEDILSGMMVNFFVKFLKTDTDARELSTMMMNTYLNITLYFFRIDKAPNARQQLLELIGKLHTEKPI